MVLLLHITYKKDIHNDIYNTYSYVKYRDRKIVCVTCPLQCPTIK